LAQPDCSIITQEGHWMKARSVSSGIASLDAILQRLRVGDNVVWQVDQLEDYTSFAGAFLSQALRDGRQCLYIRFASHAPVVQIQPGLQVVEVNPAAGFDSFCSEVHRVIEETGKGAFYIFDNLSSLLADWATDELLANFFQLTCPYLYEQDTVAYFALIRGKHSNRAVARIRDTTQVLISVYRVDEKAYVHPLKVWDRYSSQMFLPHEVCGAEWSPVFNSGEAAQVSSSAHRSTLGRFKPVGMAPWESVYARLLEFRTDASFPDPEGPEVLALKEELLRMLMGTQPEFIRLAKHHFSVEDLCAIRERVIGSGRIGGKAAGMLLARRILSGQGEHAEWARAMESHDSFYIGSDVFFTFLVDNNLFRTRLQLTSGASLSREEFERIERRFLEGQFPAEFIEQFEQMLDYFGQAPVIVRSSSLLEDSFGNAFAGKYRSEFCPNQGSPGQRMEAFLRAVRLVYASALNPDALSYRKNRGLGDRDEQMAILVQRVAGMPYKHFFFPSLAGVAFSRNLHAWSSRIDPHQGALRLVFGLGTRAVNRVGNDYPRMIAVSHPDIRPEVGMKVVKYSQRDIDLLDLRSNEFVTQSVRDVLQDCDYPNLHLLVSKIRDGYLLHPLTAKLDGPPESLVLTFNNLITRTPFVTLLGGMLEELEKAYGHPVDTEFTASINAEGEIRINLVQCRPMWIPGAATQVEIPEIPAADVLFRAHRMINGGYVPDIRYVVYVDPRKYGALKDLNVKRSLGKVVGAVHNHPSLSESAILTMGPGRWGSSSVDLGVNVSYADIHRSSVLVELAREEAGHMPEVSYGTHFFLDLVEGQIIYLPVYPEDPNTSFSERFFAESPNSLSTLLPQFADFEAWVKLIDVPAAAEGRHAHVVADASTQAAVSFLR
jgi:pyruvate, water dikinase